jgi:integrase
LRRALNQAVKWDYLVRNVATLVDKPRADTKEIEPLTPEQARVFLKAVQGDRLEALYTVALALGLRKSEAPSRHFEIGMEWRKRVLDMTGQGLA